MVGIAAAVGVILVFAGGDGDSANPAVATGSPFVPSDDDGQAIEDVARKSIDVLREGQWPTLYDDFTAEFQARCTPEEFAQVGVEAATAQAENLELLGFVAMEDVTITGDTAKGTIVGEVRGQFKYGIEAAFARVDGAWKIAPVAGTTGCAGFKNLY